MGDSLTDPSPFYGVRPSASWPEVLAVSLRAANKDYKARNFGVSGDTTCQMLGRISQMSYYDVPNIAAIFGGVNDPGAATTVNGAGATTTTVPVQSGKAAALVGGYVTISGETRLVLSRSTDTITLATPLSTAPASTTAVSVATQRNIEEMIDAIQAAGCQKIIVISAHYLNFSSGGDTTSTPYAAYVPVRAAQQAAATAQGVVFCDLYAWMRQLIVSGTDTQGSNSWHAFANNQHLNTYGESIVAAAVLARIQAQQPNWA